MATNIPQPDQIVVRKMAACDAKTAAHLSAELGYPAAADDIAARLRSFENLPQHVVFAACLNGQVVGWIDVAIIQHLQSAPFGEIGGLVVSERHRGLGIGSKLVEYAERWIVSQGVSSVLVRSRSTRERAHKFYLERDYSLWKTSLVFTKILPGGAKPA
jgi:GNAT superfamily N-acetyltransferase